MHAQRAGSTALRRQTLDDQTQEKTKHIATEKSTFAARSADWNWRLKETSGKNARECMRADSREQLWQHETQRNRTAYQDCVDVGLVQQPQIRQKRPYPFPHILHFVLVEIIVRVYAHSMLFAAGVAAASGCDWCERIAITTFFSVRVRGRTNNLSGTMGEPVWCANSCYSLFPPYGCARG